MAEKTTSRRGFLELILGGGILAFIGAALYPIIKYIIPPPTAEANLSQLKLPFTRAEIEADPKQEKYFQYGRELGIIFITDKGELKALSATCTHLDCTVQYRRDLGLIWCACHNGKYSVDGQNVSGPPPRPLFPFVVKEADGVIIVSKENA